ncbi:hypothetical protein MNV49_005509 [Pseudohyphozyma bogoriensis]|nr:hypothetical protein MNV49_005509 [Pseudohyphozyma bogoriensis]
MSAGTGYLSLALVEFAYEATTDDELTVEENQLVYVLENDDPEWFKVKLKTSTLTSPPSVGLVPASYLTSPPLLKSVVALYDYSPTRTETGEMENDEEMEITEGEKLELYEDEGDWVLVGKAGGGGVGFVPGSYVDEEGAVQATEEAEPEEEEEAPGAAPPAPYVDPSERVAAAKAVGKGGEVKTWGVTEIDKKKKKKKGTLGVGNGAVFFASESDKNPVQQYPLSTLTDLQTEKSKHLHLTFPSPVGELHFAISDKHEFDEIIAKIEEVRLSSSTEPEAPRFVPPPPSAAGSGIRGTGVSDLPPPPIRTAASRAVSSTSVPKASSTPPPAPAAPTAEAGNAVALYDFDPDGDDEVAIFEGERFEVIKGGSDDDDWVKIRKESGHEGVVPASYVQVDEGADEDDGEDEEARLAAEAEAAAAAEHEARLAAQIQAEQAAAERKAKAKLAADREAKEALRKREKEKEAARQNRLSSMPKPERIPIPDNRADVENGDEPPRLAARPGKERANGGGSSGGKRVAPSGKPTPGKVRTWKDRSGQFRVEAEFLGMNGSKIRLHKLNGVIIEVPKEKMSGDDLTHLAKLLGSRSSSHHDDDKPLSQVRDEHRERDRGDRPSASRSSSRPQVQPAKKKPQTDWFDFFLNAGCDMDDCTRYASNFDKEKIEESLVADLEASNLRTLGLREGDIIRVMKHIKEKFGPPPTPEKSDRDARLAAEASMQRSLGPTPPPPNIFTNADGGLKSTRRERPSRSASSATADAFDASAFASATSKLSERTSTPPIRGASPSVVVSHTTGGSSLDPSRRSSSTIPQTEGGFDDDAWQNRPVSKPATPAPAPAAPVAPAPPPAPTPPAAPPAPAPPVVEPPRPASAAAPSTEGLTYNDGLLAQLGIGARPPSAPTGLSTNSYGSSNGIGHSPSPVAFNPNAPRAPIAPIAANQALLAPLIPTQTGFNRPMMPNMTGYPGVSAPMAQNFTGMPMQSQAGSFGGMQAPMSMQPTGFMQPQQTGFVQPQQTGFMQPQPTGFLQPQATAMPYQQQQSFNTTPGRFSPAQPVQFNPTPPPPQTSAPPTSSTTAQFQPNNIFASMKDGTFAAGSSKLGPQDSSKYDALRPQPTGFQQPQMTGFQQPMQPQMTGYQQQPLQPQATGIMNFGYQQNGQPNPQGYGQFPQRQF